MLGGLFRVLRVARTLCCAAFFAKRTRTVGLLGSWPGVWGAICLGAPMGSRGPLPMLSRGPFPCYPVPWTCCILCTYAACILPLLHTGMCGCALDAAPDDCCGSRPTPNRVHSVPGRWPCPPSSRLGGGRMRTPTRGIEAPRAYMSTHADSTI